MNIWKFCPDQKSDSLLCKYNEVMHTNNKIMLFFYGKIKTNTVITITVITVLALILPYKKSMILLFLCITSLYLHNNESDFWSGQNFHISKYLQSYHKLYKRTAFSEFNELRKNYWIYQKSDFRFEKFRKKQYLKCIFTVAKIIFS